MNKLFEIIVPWHRNHSAERNNIKNWLESIKRWLNSIKIKIDSENYSDLIPDDLKKEFKGDKFDTEKKKCIKNYLSHSLTLSRTSNETIRGTVFLVSD